jgi:hypothetical protein
LAFGLDATFDFATVGTFFVAGFALRFCLIRAGVDAAVFAADPFVGSFAERDSLFRFLAALIALAPRTPVERIDSMVFWIGSLPFADESPTKAPAIPPATAPTGPATIPPMTAPVMPPAVCLDTEGRFFSRTDFLDMIVFSGSGIVNVILLAEHVCHAQSVRTQKVLAGRQGDLR